MEPEPTTGALLKAITALANQVRSLQDQVTSQNKQIIQLVAICWETNDLVGNKDQGGAQTKPGPLAGLQPLLPRQEEKPTLQQRLGLGSRPPSAHQGPKMDLLDPYKGDIRGCKATQWLDQMMLWVALHCNQFDKEEQMVVWILYHMTNKAANWALPIIGAIIKGKGNPPTTIQALMAKFKEVFADPNAKQAAARKIAALSQTTTTSKYITEFRNLMAELDWNEEPTLCSLRKASTGRNPNYVTPEERDRCRASGLCVKCGQKGHGIKQCPNGWKATAKEAAKIGEVKSEKDQWPSHTIPFLVCPIGNTPAILGMSWLTSESPLIDWQQGLVMFPEQVQIASEEEADPDPIADLPTQYQEFARVFGKEEFKVLPPHWEYDIAIDLVPDAKLSPGPLYGMTDAESKVLKQHIEEELATGKICPSTSSTGAPVMFVKKQMVPLG
ncbi:hypothetical protein RHS01_09945, partial [Rhizoctonia solani]